MATKWTITMKPTFLNEWDALNNKEVHQVMDKLKMLVNDPHPDAKVKKQLKYLDGKLHRLRSGDYRIFYTFDESYISLLALRRRTDDTYDEDIESEFLGGLIPELNDPGLKPHQPDWEAIFAHQVPPKKKFPEVITTELLERLRIPTECHPRLLALDNEEDLLTCPGVLDEYLLRLDEYMFSRPLSEVAHQIDLFLEDAEDLLKYKEGSLTSFLLKLSPEQERVVKWGL